MVVLITLTRYVAHLLFNRGGSHMQNLVKHVSQRIRYLRKSANLTQEQLSELLDIDRSYIGKIERGEVNVSLDTLERIAVALKSRFF
ncbi:helix-turn-helix domain-containing protein [Paenibacillus rhizoplanae]